MDYRNPVTVFFRDTDPTGSTCRGLLLQVLSKDPISGLQLLEQINKALGAWTKGSPDGEALLKKGKGSITVSLLYGEWNDFWNWSRAFGHLCSFSEEYMLLKVQDVACYPYRAMDLFPAAGKEEKKE